MSEAAENLEYEEPERQEPQEQDGASDEKRQKAESQGWSPKDQWRGNPADWVDAEEFLERGEKHVGILRERNDRLTSEISALREELRSSVKQFGESTRRAEERAYQKAIADLRTAQETAVESGDTESWRKLETQKDELNKDFQDAQRQQAPQPARAAPDADPAFTGWQSENKWYNEDVEMTVYANEAAKIISRKYPVQPGQMPPREFYNDVAREVKKKFADKFRNSNRDTPSSVQGGTQAGGRQNKGRGYSDLPSDAKTACDKFVRQGLMTKEEYIKEYFGE